MTGKHVSLGEGTAIKGQHDLLMGTSEEGMNSGEQKELPQSRVTTEVASTSANDDQLLSHNKADTLVSRDGSIDSHLHANKSNYMQKTASTDRQEVNKTKTVNLTKTLPPPRH